MKNPSLPILMKIIYGIFSFLFPIGVLLMAFHKKQVIPFGDNSILNMDLWGQYFPMYIEQAQQIGQSLIPGFSWNGAFGFNAYAQAAYYSNSPLNLLFNFVAQEDRVALLHFLILVKNGLASLTMFLYALSLSKKMKQAEFIAFIAGVLYSLNAYMLAFATQPMWLDTVVLLPIIVWGLERLLNENKKIIYTLTLSLAICINFYIGFSVCVFLLLFTLSRLAILRKGKTNKEIGSIFLKFISYSLLSVGIAAVVLMPVSLSIFNTAASTNSVQFGFESYHNFIQILRSFLPLAPFSLEYGVANVYGGSILLLLVPLYFMNISLSSSQKWADGILLMFLMASLTFRPLDFLWHGFRFPNQLPGRWSFILVFMLISLAVVSYHKRAAITFSNVVLVVLNVLLLISTIDLLPTKFILSPQVKWWLLSLYLGVLTIMYIQKKGNSALLANVLSVFLTFMVLAESSINAYMLIQTDLAVSSAMAYNRFNVPMKDALQVIHKDIKPIQRVEMLNIFTFNPGQLFNYPGLSYYGSTMNGMVFNHMKNLGHEVYGDFVSTIFRPTFPLFNSMSSIRYLIGPSQIEAPTGFELKERVDNLSIFENKYFLNFGYLMPQDIVTYRSSGSKHFIESYNKLSRVILGKEMDLYTRQDFDTVEASNATYEEDKSWDNQYYHREKLGETVRFKFTKTITEFGEYLLVHNFRGGDFVYSVNGEAPTPINLNQKCVSFGELPIGSVIEFTLEARDIEVGLYGIELFRFDQEVFEQSFNVLNQTKVNVDSFKNNRFSATVNSEIGGIFVTSIPQDGGWRVKVNGLSNSLFSYDETFIAIPLSEGINTLEFSYRVPGLVVGSLISCVSLIILALSVSRFKIRRK